MYSLTGCQWLEITPQEPIPSQKDPVLTQIKRGTDTYQSSQNEPIPPINSGKKMVEFMDSSSNSTIETLLKQQIFLMKFILLFLGFLLLSNILNKKN